MNRNETIQYLVEMYYKIDSATKTIFLLKGSPKQSIKLLIVNSYCDDASMHPVFFDKNEDIPFDLVVIEIKPGRAKDICSGKVTLPNGWKIDKEIKNHD